MLRASVLRAAVLAACAVMAAGAYNCPANSGTVFAPSEYFGDCECNEGWEKDGAACTASPTPAPSLVPTPAPTPAPETGGTYDGKKKNCVGAGVHANTPGMGMWCIANCNNKYPYCPSTHCSCSVGRRLTIAKPVRQSPRILDHARDNNEDQRAELATAAALKTAMQIRAGRGEQLQDEKHFARALNDKACSRSSSGDDDDDGDWINVKSYGDCSPHCGKTTFGGQPYDSSDNSQVQMCQMFERMDNLWCGWPFSDGTCDGQYGYGTVIRAWWLHGAGASNKAISLADADSTFCSIAKAFNSTYYPDCSTAFETTTDVMSHFAFAITQDEFREFWEDPTAYSSADAPTASNEASSSASTGVILVCVVAAVAAVVGVGYFTRSRQSSAQHGDDMRVVLWQDDDYSSI